MSGHPPEPLRERLRVAVHAPGTDLGATPDGVPRGIGPFNFGIGAHGMTVFICTLPVNCIERKVSSRSCGALRPRPQPRRLRARVLARVKREKILRAQADG